VKCFSALDLDPMVKIRRERELTGEELGFRPGLLARRVGGGRRRCFGGFWMKASPRRCAGEHVELGSLGSVEDRFQALEEGAAGAGAGRR
jgi:hypothetical protein